MSIEGKSIVKYDSVLPLLFLNEGNKLFATNISSLKESIFYRGTSAVFNLYQHLSMKNYYSLVNNVAHNTFN